MTLDARMVFAGLAFVAVALFCLLLLATPPGPRPPQWRKK